MIKNFYNIYVKAIVSKITLDYLYNIFKLIVMLIVSKLFDYAINGNTQIIISIASRCILITIVVCFLKYLLEIYLSILSKKYREKFNFTIYNKLLNSPFELIEDKLFGEIISRITRDVDKIVEILEGKTILLVVTLLSGISYFIYSLTISVTFSIIISCIGLSTLIIPIILKKAYKESYIMYGDAWDDYENHLNTTLNGFNTIKLNNLYSFFENNNEIALKNMQKVSNNLDSISVTEDSLKTAVKNIGEIIMYILIGLLTYKDIITVDQIIICLFLGREIFNIFPIIFNEYHNFQNLLISIERINEVLEEDISEGTLTISELKDIEIKALNFSYTNGEAVLKDINLKIKNGDKILLKGTNGSGKSTLVKVLLNLYTRYNGTIKINDIKLKKYKKDDIKNLLSYLPQEQFFLSENPIENLTTFSKNEEIISKYLTKFDLSIDYLKNKRISELSGGEKQKISLVRTLTSSAKAIILDEPTNYLDNNSIEVLKNTIKESSKTIIVISHLSSMDEIFNKIVLLENGTINLEDMYHE